MKLLECRSVVCRSIQYVSIRVAMHALIKDVEPFSAEHRDQNIKIFLENP
jgi:hypothetical protein